MRITNVGAYIALATAANAVKVQEQTAASTEFAPLALLPAYETGKKVADTVCLVWENKELLLAGVKIIGKAGKAALNAMKNGLKLIDSADFKKALGKAGKLAIKKIGKAAKKVGKAAKKAAKKVGKKAKKAAKKVGKKAKKAAKKAKKTAKKIGKKLKFWKLAQTSSTSEAEVRVMKKSLGDKMKKVMKVMLKIMEHSPWGDQIEATQTIIDFIKDLDGGKKMKVGDIMDVACAINCFFPSSKDLTKFLLGSKSFKKKITQGLTKGGKKNISSLKANAKIINKNVLKSMKNAGTKKVKKGKASFKKNIKWKNIKKNAKAKAKEEAEAKAREEAEAAIIASVEDEQ